MIRREMWIHNYLFVLTAKSSLLISSWKSRILMKSKSNFNLHFSKIWILKKIHKSTFLNFCDKFEWNFANFLILFATKILRYPILTPKLEFWWKFANQLFWIFTPIFEWLFTNFWYFLMQVYFSSKIWMLLKIGTFLNFCTKIRIIFLHFWLHK